MRFGHGLLRALYFIPHLTTAVAMAWVWRWFYQPPPVGAFNVWLTALGFGQMPFLRSTTQALPAVLAPAIWAGIGFQVVVFLAGLKAIPRTYYEAAAIDGAGAWRVLFEVTLPLLRPTIVFLVVTSSIAYLRIFDYVYAMTERPRRTARRYEAAGAEDIRDRLHAFRDGLRRDPDRYPVCHPAGDLAHAIEAVAQPMSAAGPPQGARPPGGERRAATLGGEPSSAGGSLRPARAEWRRERSSPGPCCSWAASSW